MPDRDDARGTRKIETSQIGAPTVKLEVASLRQEDPSETAPPPAATAAKYDGRFGERFDDEISTSAVTWVLVGIVLIGVAAFLGMGWLEGWFDGRLAAEPASPVFAAGSPEKLAAGAPALQVSPEGELRALRAEMAARTEGYGWVDQGAGLAYVPVETAIDRVLELGLGAPGPATSIPSPKAAPTSTEQAAEPGAPQP